LTEPTELTATTEDSVPIALDWFKGNAGPKAPPVLLISSPDDETSRARNTTRPEDLPGAAVTARELPGFGHCDLILGTDAPARVWPVIDQWLKTT